MLYIQLHSDGGITAHADFLTRGAIEYFIQTNDLPSLLKDEYYHYENFNKCTALMTASLTGRYQEAKLIIKQARNVSDDSLEDITAGLRGQFPEGKTYTSKRNL